MTELYIVVDTLYRLLQSLIVRDTVRECLEKDPAERTDDDIEVLLDFLQHLLVSRRSSSVCVRACVCACKYLGRCGCLKFPTRFLPQMIYFAFVSPIPNNFPEKAQQIILIIVIKYLHLMKTRSVQ